MVGKKYRITVSDSSKKYADITTDFSIAEAAAFSGTVTGAASVDPSAYPDYADYGAEFDSYDISVDVTIENGVITAVASTTDAGSNASYLKKALNKAVSKYVGQTVADSASLTIDIATGATYSSNGIINAVKNALIKASGGTVTEVTGSTGLGNIAQPVRTTTTEEPFTDGSYQDGTYMGTASGFGGNITVRVTITDGKISAVDIVSASGETPSYLAKAKAVISKVISTTVIRTLSGLEITEPTSSSSNWNWIKRAVNGSSSRAGILSQIQKNNSVSDLDVVSGATCSSRAIIQAAQSIEQQLHLGTTENKQEER